MKLINFKYLIFLICLLIISINYSCKTFIPSDLDALDEKIEYNNKDFSFTIGRTQLIGSGIRPNAWSNDSRGSSTTPLNFEILDVKDAEGVSHPEFFTKLFPIKIWKTAYTGKEKSLEEIDEKMAIEYRPAFDMQKHTGDIIFWNTTSFLDLETQPLEGYTMDVAISNTGGRKIQRNLKVRPKKPRETEPNLMNDISGLNEAWDFQPSVKENIVGTRTYDGANNVKVYIIRDYANTNPGSTLTISVVDSLYQPIDIELFNETKFDNLVHGFNKRFIDKSVVYDVRYPMPLSNGYRTDYTNGDGTRASILLSYKRLNAVGYQDIAKLGFNFAIYEPGHWIIQFRFAEQSPKFEDDIKR